MPAKTPTLILLALTMILALISSACGGTAGEAPPAPTQAESSAEPSEVGVVSDTSQNDLPSEGTDLAGVNTCQQIPAEEVSVIVGPLREDDTSQDVSIAGEAGCTYYDQEGQFYDLSYEPLYIWGTVEYALNEAQPVEDLLDGAWMGRYDGGEITVKVLVKGELVIGVHISAGDLETARSLAALAYQYRP